MAEPVTTAEVEDVLSSIRRLVGETKRHEQTRIQASNTDMLVLTPQLRVAQDPDVFEFRSEHRVQEVTKIDTFEEPPLAEVVTEQPDVPTDEPLQLSPEARIPTIEVRPTSQAEFTDLSAKIAALETAIARTADQWEPDGDSRDAYSGTRAPAMQWSEGIELDGSGRPVLREVDGVAAASHVQDVEDHLEAALEEQVIDEDTLREMVAEIVRSELRGELGERLTRNIRKLVRSEIHRALTTQRMSS